MTGVPRAHLEGKEDELLAKAVLVRLGSGAVEEDLDLLGLWEALSTLWQLSAEEAE